MDKTKGELEFIDQMTRKLMVEWCHEVVQHGILPWVAQTSQAPKGLSYLLRHYIDYAAKKKWISADKSKILAAGWATAARFLKR